MRYAGFWKRFHAYKIDLFLVTLITIAANYFVSTASAEGMGDLARELQAIQQLNGSSNINPSIEATSLLGSLINSLLLATVISAIYNIGFVAGKHQATPGKRYGGIRVVMEDGSRPTLIQSTIRHLASGVTILTGGLGFLSIVYSREKLALHDALAHTRVIYKEVL